MEVAKEQFGIEITRLLRERKLTQRGLASFLGISSAAVCYLLKNQLHPSPAQFDGIMEYLHAEPQLINKLRHLWNATRKKSPKRQEVMENLFAIRCAKDISIEELSQATGISQDRLRDLENKAGVVPTPEETTLLKEFYGPQTGLDQLSEEEEPIHRVAEEFSDEIKQSEKELPLFSIDVLSRAAKSVTLEKFLEKIPFETGVFNVSPRHFHRAKAILVCKADDIHFGFQGTMEIVLAEYDPESTDSLHLGRGSRGGFALWQKMRRSWKYFGSEMPPPRMSNAWSLPVLEVHFVATPRTNNASRKK